jgi:hypothetical protein
MTTTSPDAPTTTGPFSGTRGFVSKGSSKNP